ncbi:MAG: molybdate ABC transporter substrate-binding protein, partial [Desulfurococcus sp.]
MSRTIVLSVILLVLVVSSWMIYTYYSQSPVQVELLVYTPPVIQPLLENASREYMQLHPNVRIEIIGGATGTLLNKISLTGEGDVFITADHEYMLNASRMGLVVNESIKVLSYVVLALIIPRDNPANITSLDDLVLKNVKIGIANPNVAPFGRMAVELLVRNGIYDKVKDKLVIYGDVGQTARQVALGLVDVAILPHVAHYWYLNDTSIIWL